MQQLAPEVWVLLIIAALFGGFVLGRFSKPSFAPLKFTRLADLAAYLFTIKMEKIMAKDINHSVKVGQIGDLTDAYKTIVSDKELTHFDQL